MPFLIKTIFYKCNNLEKSVALVLHFKSKKALEPA